MHRFEDRHAIEAELVFSRFAALNVYVCSSIARPYAHQVVQVADRILRAQPTHRHRRIQQ